MTFVNEVMRRAEPIIQNMKNCAFIREITSGCLPHEKLKTLFGADLLYLDAYLASFQATAARAPRLYKRNIDYYVEMTIYEREGLRQYYAQMFGAEKPHITPAARAYIAHVTKQREEPFEVAAAALGPCILVYHEVWAHAARVSCANNPHEDLLKSMADKRYANLAKDYARTINAISAGATPITQEKMHRTFGISTQMESNFLHDAYMCEHSLLSPFWCRHETCVTPSSSGVNSTHSFMAQPK